MKLVLLQKRKNCMLMRPAPWKFPPDRMNGKAWQFFLGFVGLTVFVFAFVVVYLFKFSRQNSANKSLIVWKSLISLTVCILDMFFIHYRVSASPVTWTHAAKTVSASQTTSWRPLRVNVTLITGEHHAVSVEKHVPIGRRWTQARNHKTTMQCKYPQGNFLLASSFTF